MVYGLAQRRSHFCSQQLDCLIVSLKECMCTIACVVDTGLSIYKTTPEISDFA